MAIDTPARIAILGAGPIGLEAALYARYLGYDVDIYERGRVAENVRRWQHVRMFTPFEMNRSPLGLAALKAQDPSRQPPTDDAFLTGGEYAARYLAPLAASDLLADCLHEHTEVVSIGRDGPLKGHLAGDETRGDFDFRLLVRGSEPRDHPRERMATADVVIDAGGTYAQHNWLGRGGIPAAGESAAQAHIEYGLCDVLGGERGRYAHRRTLLVGDGLSAATNLVTLAELASQASDTWITWLTRVECDERAGQPVRTIADDPLPQRATLAARANRLAASDANHVSFLSGTWVESLAWHEDLERFSVRLSGKHAGEEEFDRIIANVGFHGDERVFRELHVEICPVTGAPSPIAKALADPAMNGSAVPHPSTAANLMLAEPDFYILGAKSFGRDSRFLIAEGIAQIRALFTIIGDRADLNLYATMAGLY